MMNENVKKVVKVVLPLLIALLSVLVVSKYAMSAETHAKTIESLDEKKTVVMELAAASTAASAAITLIPGDTATPIAEKLADLSSYFLLILCALYLEKYLVTVTGYAAFVWLIPAGCAVYAANVFLKNDTLQQFAKKIVIFGLAIFLVIPASVKVSNLIEKTYNSSIEQTIEKAKETTTEIENSTTETETTETEKQGFFSGLVSKVKNEVTVATEKLQNVLNNFIEAIAVMLVTSCIIPILVLLFFFWLIKIVLGVDMRPVGAMKRS